ncbi:4F2 cell-surface antigen heavy chain [Chanos chanos]|uniref:4F2 cell-surface antigen heavy chain n=1 Tax=Chanos chanos TaxID=29144 RepID=A0A6J2VP29_CHACN|nr:4F2 cell-surface antigen heavy chain-like [Chanos chanos]
MDSDPGYGSVAVGIGPGLAGSLEGSETVPLLIPEADESQWRPMTREELEQAAGGPGWKKLRSRLVLLFWLSWLAMLGVAVAIVVQSPRPVAPPLHWWQRELFYSLQPAVFMDGDGAEASSISAVAERLPYLKSLGVGVMILEGVFRYDVSPPNLTMIDEHLGTSLQFQQLIIESHKAGIKVVLDLCELDLFSGQEPANETDGLSDASGHIQYSLRYWLEQGVSGFAICDADPAFSEKTLTEWRLLIQEFNTKDDERIVMVRQMGKALPAFNASGPAVNGSLVELVTKPLLPPSPNPLSAQEVANAMETNLQKPQEEWPSWTVGGKASSGLENILMVLMMTLPGTPIIKYGEEISPSQVSTKMTRPLGLFQSLSRMRAREEALRFGSFTFLPFNATSVGHGTPNATATATVAATPPLAFLRSWGCVHFLVLFNLGSVSHTLDPDWAPSLPEGGVYVTSTGLDRLGSVSLQSMQLRPKEAVVIKLFETGNVS